MLHTGNLEEGKTRDSSSKCYKIRYNEWEYVLCALSLQQWM